MTLAIGMLNVVFPLQPKTQKYHIKYPNVITLNVTMYQFSNSKRYLFLTNSTMLTISKCDTLRPLGLV